MILVHNKSNVHVPYEKHLLGYVVSYLPSYIPQHLGKLMKQTIQECVCATGTKYKIKTLLWDFVFKSLTDCKLQSPDQRLLSTDIVFVGILLSLADEERVAGVVGNAAPVRTPVWTAVCTGVSKQLCMQLSLPRWFQLWNANKQQQCQHRIKSYDYFILRVSNHLTRIVHAKHLIVAASGKLDKVRKECTTSD